MIQFQLLCNFDANFYKGVLDCMQGALWKATAVRITV